MGVHHSLVHVHDHVFPHKNPMLSACPNNWTNSMLKNVHDHVYLHRLIKITSSSFKRGTLRSFKQLMWLSPVFKLKVITYSYFHKGNDDSDDSHLSEIYLYPE